MVSWKSQWIMASVLGILSMGGAAQAQDQETGGTAGFSGSVSASGSGVGSGAGSGLYLELQARLDAFNVAGVESTSIDSGNGGVLLSAPAIPFVTAGVRLLDGDLFVGLGAGFTSAKRKSESPAGDRESSRSSFMLAPVATYDLLGEGPAALYGLGMLKLGSVGSGDEDPPGPDVEAGFWWGLSLGVGLRGDITENVGIFSELGWGFSRGSWDAAGVDETRFVHGLFGTLGFAVRLGL